jgi:hypothetical protein
MRTRAALLIATFAVGLLELVSAVTYNITTASGNDLLIWKNRQNASKSHQDWQLNSHHSAIASSHLLSTGMQIALGDGIMSFHDVFRVPFFQRMFPFAVQPIAKLRKEITTLKRKLEQLRIDCKQDMEQFRIDYKQDMEQFRIDYKQDIAKMRADHSISTARLKQRLSAAEQFEFIKDLRQKLKEQPDFNKTISHSEL